MSITLFLQGHGKEHYNEDTTYHCHLRLLSFVVKPGESWII